jgi:murein DD-endopeptidase MepM/ murein hydrolase activator NlpD
MPMRVAAPGEVPSTFAPSVSEGETPMSPTNSPYVAPMRNAAPGQLEQTGATLTQAGEMASKIGNTIADRVQETMDDAQTKAAENQFLQAALPTLGQYKNSQGINATQLFDPTAQAITKARQDARATLTNPIQQRMFDQVTNDHMLTFGSQMADHENVQRVEEGKKQSIARAQNLNGMSMLDVAGRNRDDSNFATLGKASDDEVLNAAQLSGIAPDSPMADQMLRQNRTQRYASVIDSLKNQNAYSEASNFFDAHKDEMDPHQVEQIGGELKRAKLLVEGTQKADQRVQILQKTPGAGPISFPMPGSSISATPDENGLSITAAPGTRVLAPASGTVTAVGNDEVRGNFAEITFPSGYVAKFSGLGAVNYKEGQEITAGQAIGLSGKDDNGNAVTHYSMTDPSGKFIADPRTAVSAPLDPKNFYKPEDEAKVIADINANESDDLLRRVEVNRIESLANHNREIMNQQHADAVKQATDYWFKNGQSLSGLPADVSGQLTPTDIAEFSEKAKQQYLLNQAVLGEKEVGLLANWDEHPDQVTTDAVKTAYAQGKLSNRSYLERMNEATAMQKNSLRPIALAVDHDQLTNILSLNGFPHLAQPDTAGSASARAAAQLERVQLENAVKNEIDLQQTNLKRELNWQDKQKIMRDMIIDKVYTSGNSATNLKPAAILTSDDQSQAHVWIGNQQVRMKDIPPQYALKAIQDLEANGLPSTQANIAAWWLKKGKPAQ